MGGIQKPFAERVVRVPVCVPQSRSQDEDSTASALCGASQKEQIGAGQAGSAGGKAGGRVKSPSSGHQQSLRWRTQEARAEHVVRVIPRAMTAAVLGHVRAGCGGVVHPGVDWRKSPQELSNMLHLGEGRPQHQLVLIGGDGWARDPRICSEVSRQPARVRCHPLMETERMSLRGMQ